VLRKEKNDKYFIVGKTYLPNDLALSEEMMADTVIIEFSRLYPLYEMMRDRKFS
jgi:hypothetical protein